MAGRRETFPACRFTDALHLSLMPGKRAGFRAAPFRVAKFPPCNPPEKSADTYARVHRKMLRSAAATGNADETRKGFEGKLFR